MGSRMTGKLVSRNTDRWREGLHRGCCGTFQSLLEGYALVQGALFLTHEHFKHSAIAVQQHDDKEIAWVAI